LKKALSKRWLPVTQQKKRGGRGTLQFFMARVKRGKKHLRKVSNLGTWVDLRKEGKEIDLETGLQKILGGAKEEQIASPLFEKTEKLRGLDWSDPYVKKKKDPTLSPRGIG